MKNPGPRVSIRLISRQFFMSMMLTTPDLRLGVAITGRPW